MRFKIARILRSFSQYDLAARTGIPQSSISLIERGYKIPKEIEKEKIAEALGREILELFPEG